MIVVRGLGAGRLSVVRRMAVFLCAGPEFDGADLSGVMSRPFSFVMVQWSLSSRCQCG